MENNGEEKLIPQIDVVESPKKDHHIFTVSLLVLCALASLAVFAYTNLYLYKQAFEQASAVETSVVQTDETQNWKTYRNEEYGFEFKYPSSWINSKALTAIEDNEIKGYLPYKDLSVYLVDSAKENEYIEYVKNYEGIGSGFNYVGYGGDLVSISIFNERLADSLENIVEKPNDQDDGFWSEKVQDITIGGSVAKKAISRQEWEGSATYTIVAIKNPNIKNQIINLKIHYNEGKYQKEIFEKILSTFKFISPEVDNRILLTDKILESLYASTTLSLCKEKINHEEPNTSVLYKNTEKGISFEIPYNANWGTTDYKISHYVTHFDSDALYESIEFGRLVGQDGCGWGRAIQMWFLSQKSANSTLLDLKSDPMLVQMGEPSIVSINGLEVVKYTDYGYSSYPTFVVIGKKYNYAFGSGNVEFEDLEEIVKTVKLIE